MSGLYLQSSAARQGQGLQLFVYVQSGATRKVVSPAGCLLVNSRRRPTDGSTIICTDMELVQWNGTK